jgi:hypothetical protein
MFTVMLFVLFVVLVMGAVELVLGGRSTGRQA